VLGTQGSLDAVCKSNSQGNRLVSLSLVLYFASLDIWAGKKISLEKLIQGESPPHNRLTPQFVKWWKSK